MIRAQPILRADELKCLEKGALLNASTIEAFLTFLERQNDVLDLPPKIMSLDPTFFFEIEKGNHDKAFRHLKRRNPLSMDLVFVPVHMIVGKNCGHWALIAVRPPLKKIEVYDSLWLPHKSHLYKCFDALKLFSRTTETPIDGASWHLADATNTIPKQMNSTDCGVYLCWYAERLANRLPITDIAHVPFDPDSFREYIKFTLSDVRTEVMPTRVKTPDVVVQEDQPVAGFQIDEFGSMESLFEDLMLNVQEPGSPIVSGESTVEESFEMIPPASLVKAEMKRGLSVSPVLSILASEEDFQLLLEDAVEPRPSCISPLHQIPLHQILWWSLWLHKRKTAS